MAEDREQEDSTVSPLFDKMDALLARHRGARTDQEIPVLSDEAAIEELAIPVLTEVVSNDELMFDLDVFLPDPMAGSSGLEIQSPPAEPVFLDLPLFELEPIDALSAETAADIPHTPSIEPAEQAFPREGISPCDIPPLDFAAEPAPVLSGEDRLALDMPELVFPDELLGDADTWTDPETYPRDQDPLTDALTLVALPVPEVRDAPEDMPSPARLSEADIADITATVAAQIAVDISTEVAQLTRQHFAAMMNSFYSDSLRRLTEEISHDMEAHLAPRIEALVQQELKRQGLAD